MYDGFYALFLLKNGSAPMDEASFAVKMLKFLGDVERNAKKLDVSPEDVYAAKYAFAPRSMKSSCAPALASAMHGSAPAAADHVWRSAGR
jgi:hypothetical protein